ncbi:MAG: SGNH/GDSL hydrolase family protein [Bacteroidia bacterium]|nr:SGNH/GDSL hydrolase family protein [Bacteroidia bacterium]
MRFVILFILIFPFFGITQNYNNIVAFGDSFTDNGYINGHGFNRDTNGYVWVEYLAQMIKCNNVDNRAWGGARTDNGHYLGFDWSGFNWQIDNYNQTMDSDKTLITVWIGVNDYWDNKDDPSNSVKNISSGLKKLIDNGGRHFLIFNNFDLTLSPGYRTNDEYRSLIPEVKKLTQRFNLELEKMLFNKNTGLEKSNPEIKIYYIDIYTFMNELVAKNQFNMNPWKGTYKFPDPNEYLWYDEWHPMTSCHKLIADLALEVLKE